MALVFSLTMKETDVEDYIGVVDVATYPNLGTAEWVATIYETDENDIPADEEPMSFYVFHESGKTKGKNMIPDAMTAGMQVVSDWFYTQIKLGNAKDGE